MAAPTSNVAPRFSTFAHQVQLGPGETLGFAPMRGFYARPAVGRVPLPAVAPQLVSDAATGGPVQAPHFSTLRSDVQLAPGQSLGFTKGRGYYAHPGTIATHPPAAAPVGTAGTGVAAAPSDTQAAQAQIAAIISPLLAQIKQTENQRAQQGEQQIAGYTTNAMNQLKGIDFQAPYQQAGQDQNAVNTALMASLQGQGSNLQDQLAAQLGTIGAPASQTSGLTGAVGAATGGAANAGLAKGDATLSSLISQGAAQGAYGQKLPGIEALAGAQDTSKLQGTVNTDLQSQLGSVTSKVPSMVQAELGALASARSKQQHDLVASLIADNKTAEALKVAAMNNMTKAQIAAAANDAKITIANANNSTKAGIASASLKVRIQQLANQTASIFGTDASGNPTLAARKAAAAAAAADKKASQMTPDAYNKLRQTAQKQADDFYNGVAPTLSSSGVQTKPGSSPVTYGPALNRLMAEGLKFQDAVTTLNAFYHPGEGGRPWVAAPGRLALQKAGMPLKQWYGKPSAQQYAYLRARGLVDY